MKHCVECGTKLEMKALTGEGDVPFCTQCNEYRFPIFNVAVSGEILNPQKDKILLIQQYGKKQFMLVAGFVNKGEKAETALVREVMEEIGLEVTAYRFMRSVYYSPSNTLIFNFACVVNSEDLSGITKEVDLAQWFTFEEAKGKLMDKGHSDGVLAERLVLNFINHYSPEDQFVPADWLNEVDGI